MNTTHDHTAGPDAGQEPFGNASSQTHPGQRRSLFDSLRGSGMVRTEDRWIGGVAGGLARRTGLDPLLFRGLLIVLTVFGGLGLLLYGLGWALLPEERDGRIHLQQAGRGAFDVALAGAILFVLIGLSRPAFWWLDSAWSAYFALASLTVLALTALVISLASRPSREAVERAPWAAPAPAAGPAPAPAAGSMPAAGPAPAPAAASWADTSTSGAARASAGVDDHAAASAAPPAPPNWTPPPPRGPVIPGPGRATVSIVLALSLLILAALAIWDRIADVFGLATTAENGLNVALVGFGAILAVFGMALGVTALRGRRGKGLTAMGVFALICLLPVAMVAAFIPIGMPSVERHESAVSMGEYNASPVLPSDAEGGYSVNAGALELDLTQLDLDAADDLPLTVPVAVGAGVAELTIPHDIPVMVETDIALGAIEGYTQSGWVSDTGGATTGHARTWSSGGFVSGTYRNPLAQEEEPVLVLEVVVRTGLIEIREG